MKILVIGGAGFIGSCIALELAKDPDDQIVIYDIRRPRFNLPINIAFVEGDILDRSLLDETINGCNEIYNCAGLLGTHELIFQAGRAVDVNIKGAVHILQSCRDNNVKKLFHPTKPIFSNYWENTYTITKISAENFARMYREIYGMDITILRWMNASGPGQQIYPIRKFIPLAICAALLDIDIEIYGDGKQTMDVIDVRDVASIAIKAVRSGIGRIPQIWDVGTGIPITVCEVAKYIIGRTTSLSQIIHTPMRVGEALGCKIFAKNHNELLRLINYELKFDLYQTLDDAIDYYKNFARSKLYEAVNYHYGYSGIARS